MKHFISFLPILSLNIFAITANAQTDKDWRLYNPNSTSVDSLKMTTATDSQSTNQRYKEGTIQYFQDSKIDLLDSLRTEHPSKLSGFRVQIFFGDRDEAREKRADFIREHPEVGAYISYLAPNFRLRVGDFRSRLECEAFKKEIAGNFPGSYLVKDRIELPALRPELEDKVDSEIE